MIVVQLKGGLGNQLFQYAAGRRLALRHNTELKLDVRRLDQAADRRFMLSVFDIVGVPLSTSEVTLLQHGSGLVGRLIPALGRPRLRRIREQHNHFDSTVLGLPNNVYLEGYWQSEQYFADIHETIRSDLQFRQTAMGRNRTLAAEVVEPGSVSVHVRRGDYVTNPTANRILGPCDLGYYRRAVERLSASVKCSRYYVFSDDPQWCRENLQLDAHITVVDHNSTDDAHEDLRLMSLCHHHVIANSSLSWWAAWLAEGDGRTTGRDRLVIAPRSWYQCATYRSDDLVPERWLRL